MASNIFVAPLTTSVNAQSHGRNVRVMTVEDIDWLMNEDNLWIDDAIVLHRYGDVGVGEPIGAPKALPDATVTRMLDSIDVCDMRLSFWWLILTMQSAIIGRRLGVMSIHCSASSTIRKSSKTPTTATTVAAVEALVTIARLNL
jgi:hypothetical protein